MLREYSLTQNNNIITKFYCADKINRSIKKTTVIVVLIYFLWIFLAKPKIRNLNRC